MVGAPGDTPVKCNHLAGVVLSRPAFFPTAYAISLPLPIRIFGYFDGHNMTLITRVVKTFVVPQTITRVPTPVT